MSNINRFSSRRQRLDHAFLSERLKGTVSYKRIAGYWVTRHDCDFDVIRLEGMETSFLRVPTHILCYLLGQSERLLWT